MQRTIIVGGAVVVLLALGAAGALLLPDRLFRAELDKVLAELPDGMTGRYADARYSPWTRTATIAGLAVESAAADLPFRLAVARIDLIDPNLDLGDALAAARSGPASAEALPVAAGFTATGIAFASSGPAGPGTGAVSYEIGRFEMADLRVYPAALLQADIAGLRAALAALEAEPPEDPAAVLDRLSPLLHTYAALYLGVGHGPFAGEAVTTTVTVEAGADDGGPGSMTARLERFSGAGFDRGVFGAASGEGLRQITDDDVDCRIERLALGESTVRPAAERSLAGEPLSASMLDGVRFGGIAVSNMACTSGAGPVALRAFSFGDVTFAHGLPTSARLALDRLTVPAAALGALDPETPAGALGLDALTLSLGAAYAWDVEAGRIALADVTLGVAELGALDLSATLTGVPPALEGLAAAALSGARLRYTDASLIERAFALAAAVHESPPAAFRAEFIAATAEQMMAEGIPPEIVETLAAFAGNPTTTLIVTFDPPEPVPLAFLAAAEAIPPPDLITLLGLGLRVGTGEE